MGSAGTSEYKRAHEVIKQELALLALHGIWIGEGP